jgi:hypothetical protein
MNRHLILCLAAVALLAPGCLFRKRDTLTPAQAKLVPEPATGERKTYTYSQQLWTQPVALYSQAQAEAIVDQFRTNYDKLGSPRILIYVNRELVDEQSGMKVSARSERTETTHTAVSSGGSEPTNTDTTKTTADNTYANHAKPAPTVADKQTVRDVERLMGRPLRAAGATLVDQASAAQLINDRPLNAINTESEQARKDREAISKVADVVLEVLISSRTVTVTELDGNKTYPVPDILVTAVRLKDSKIIGQATAAEVMNRAGGPAMAARNFTVQDVTEATSLALMDDMTREAR